MSSARSIDLRSAGGANDAHGHRAQAVEEPPVAPDRHPFVEEDLQGPPHRDPAPISRLSRMIPAALPPGQAFTIRSPTKRHAAKNARPMKRAARPIRCVEAGPVLIWCITVGMVLPPRPE